MSKILIRLWPVFNAAGIIGIAAAVILLVISLLWQFGYADLAGIFPTISPWYAIAGSAALGFWIWFRWDRLRRTVRDAKAHQDN